MNEQDIINELEDHVDALKAELIDVVEAVEVVRTNKLLLAGVAVVALAAGAAAGYYAATKVLEKKYAEIADEEIEDAKRFYSAVHKTEYPTPADAVKALIPEDEAVEEDSLVTQAAEAYTKYTGNFKGKAEMTDDGLVITDPPVETEAGVTETVTTVTSNVFVDGKPIDVDDWDAEVAARSEERPYVITEEEFFANEQDFEQWSLTYYEGDDVLTTEKDEVIEDVDEMVGELNLRKFGHMSKDMHLVYVKNNKRGLDFEIARSRGKYTVEVLDLADETPRASSRFRGDSDD
jgi:hypothetical protein